MLFYAATRSSKTLQSPDFPNIYSSSTSLKWHITAPPGDEIELVFLQVETEACCDIIKVSNSFVCPNLTHWAHLKISSNSSTLDLLSGSLDYPKIFTSKSFIVEFFTDEANSFSGFYGFYQIISSKKLMQMKFEKNILSYKSLDESLQLTASHETQVLITNGFPIKYKPNEDVSWDILAPKDQQIVFTVHEGSSQSCCDKLEVLRTHLRFDLL